MSGTGNRSSDGDGSKGERLPTFRCPRDLTLTGNLSALRSRKTYAPNIPPRRDRSSSAGSSTSRTSSPGGPASGSPTRGSPGQRGRGGRGRDGPDRGRRKPDLVQASSIFSDGVGDSDKARRFGGARGSRFGGGGGEGGGGGGRGGGRGSGGGGGGTEKSFRDRSVDDAGRLLEGSLTFQETHAKVHEIIGDGKFISDLDDEDEDIDASLVAVELPMSNYFAASLDETKQIPVPLKPELFNPELKTEEEPPRRGTIDTLDPMSFAHTVLNAPPEGTLIFFQMPDRLPVLDQTPSESSQPKEAKLATSISALPEGYIGKMQIFASGATRLLLGENSFEIIPAAPISFRQELVAIDLNDKKMTALGPVQKKFVVVPDLEQLFRDAL